MKLFVVAASRLPDIKSHGGAEVGMGMSERPVLVLRRFRVGFRSSEEGGLLTDKEVGLDQTSAPNVLSASEVLCKPLDWLVGPVENESRPYWVSWLLSGMK